MSISHSESSGLVNDRAEAFYMGNSGETYSKRGQLLVGTTTLRRTFIFAPYVSENDTVLDFGCGIGDLLQTLSAKGKVGVEINPSSREIACQRGLDVRSSLHEFSNRRFTRIISSHALEHVSNPAGTLAEMRPLLEETGLLVLLLPLDDWRSRPNRHWHPNNMHMHLYAWTPMSIGNLLIIAGFAPITISIIAHAHPPQIGDKIANFSPAMYHLLAKISSLVLCRRQLLAVAQLVE